MTKQIAIAKRGCGLPVKGGTYIYVDPSAFNESPVFEMVLDQTVQVHDLTSWGISKVGMSLIPRPGKPHIMDLYDWIGEESYPNVLDWIFEVKELGFHQKVHPTLLQHLCEDSMYFAVHPKASYKEPANAWYERLVHEDHPTCFNGHEEHFQPPNNEDKLNDLGTCPGLWVSDIHYGTDTQPDRSTTRVMPSFEYKGFVSETTHEYVPAIFFRVPIGKMAEFLVYEDNETNAHEDALKELQKLDEKLQRVKKVQL